MSLLLRKRDNLETLSDQIFASLFNNSFASYSNFMKTDIIEKEDGYNFLIDIPGISKEDIKISLEEGNLEISISSKKEENKEIKFLHKERFYGTATRTYYVGDHIKNEDIKASYDNGVLNIFIPKKEIVKEEKTFINID